MNGLIALDPAEAQYLEVVAGLRHSRHLGRTNTQSLTPGHTDGGRDEDPSGIYGEYAVSLYLNVGWRPVVENPFVMLSDIGVEAHRIQVRTTMGARNTHLILHTVDDDRAIFVLARRISPLSVSVDGWVYGHEGKNRQWWNTTLRSPCFFVPGEALRPMGTLRGHDAARMRT